MSSNLSVVVADEPAEYVSIADRTRLWGVGVKKPIREENGVECLPASGCQAAVSFLESQATVVIKNVQKQPSQAIQQGVAWLEPRFKPWTQPTKTNQVASTLTDLTRSRSDLIAENMLLRQQVIVLERQVVHPQLRQRDRVVLVMLASRIPAWRDALIIVKPGTLIRWHRRGFKLFWRWKSQAKQGRPPIAAKTIALIEEMAINNRTWRAKRIQGELLKLGIKISKETVKRST